jgi:hypothetical protein
MRGENHLIGINLEKLGRYLLVCLQDTQLNHVKMNANLPGFATFSIVIWSTFIEMKAEVRLGMHN